MIKSKFKYVSKILIIVWAVLVHFPYLVMEFHIFLNLYHVQVGLSDNIPPSVE